MSIEAEQQIIGAVTNSNSVFWRVNDILKTEHFAEPIHQEIWDYIGETISKGEEITTLSLAEKFGNNSALEAVGGRMYFPRLTAASTGVLDGKNVATHLIDSYRRSQLLILKNDIDELSGRDDVGDAWAEIQATAANILESSVSDNIKTEREVITSILDDMGKESLYYPTGLKSLDKVMEGGIYQGRGYCFAGEPKSGKTLLCATISHHLGKSGVSHLFIAAEMGSREIHQRNMAADMNEEAISFVKKREDGGFIDKVSAYNSGSCVLYYDSPRVSLRDLKMQIQGAVRKHNIKGFVLDYLQLVSGRPNKMSEADWQCEVAQWIAEVCKKENLFAIYAGQLNRDGKVRGSDGAYQAADQVYHIKRIDPERPEIRLEMGYSRYTERKNIGGEHDSPLRISKFGTGITDRNN